MFGRRAWKWSVLVVPTLCAWWAFSPRARADLQIAGYQDRLHDPYYVGPDKAFIGAAFNWSGVGRIPDPATGGTNWKSVTMISDNYFITAFHNQPNRGNDSAGPAPKVRFYRTTDPQGEYWETEIAATGNKYVGERVGLTDLWVGKLASTPPDWVTRYPLAKRQEATNYLSYTDTDLFVFGQDSPRGWTSVRVGRNEIDSVDIGGNLTWTYDPVHGLGVDEAETQIGDSGAPSFFTSGRIPVLAGVHTRENFDTGISKNLQAIIDLVGEPVSVSTGLVGDLNGNFQVNASDFFAMTTGASTVGKARYYNGDLTGDGIVDIRDFQLLSLNLGRGLFAPSDTNRDGSVDGYDLARMGASWGRSVAPFTMGDANGDGIINLADVEIFDDNQFRAYFGPLPAPLSPIVGDFTGNGVVDGFDLAVVTGNLNKIVVAGTNGDADGNGVVNSADVAFISTRLGSSFGDLNGDFEVGPSDFVVMASNWNKFVGGGRLSGDLNGDKLVNSTDARILFDWWGQQGGEFPNMLVPEPSAFGLLLMALLSTPGRLTSRRRPTSRSML
ncbi:MAG: dockerin type I domain-containing protein [Pirellulales bacterium]